MLFSTLVKSTLEIKELKGLAVNKEGITEKKEVLTTISIKPEKQRQNLRRMDIQVYFLVLSEKIKVK